MTTATAKKRGMEKEAPGIGNAGEMGGQALMVLRARELVEKVHSGQIEGMDAQARKALKGEIGELLLDSGSVHLLGVEADVVPLRCPGDPYEMGKITTLYSALVDCREYMAMRLAMGSALAKEIPHQGESL